MNRLHKRIGLAAALIAAAVVFFSCAREPEAPATPDPQDQSYEVLLTARLGDETDDPIGAQTPEGPISAQASDTPNNASAQAPNNADATAQTRAVTITPRAVRSTWSEDDVVYLVRNGEVLTTLTVTSIEGRSAQLTGKLEGAYPLGTEMTLYYRSRDYDYAGQDGTTAAAASCAFLQAPVTFVSQVGKYLTLSEVTLEHQQAYCALTFRRGPDRLPVKKLVITGSDLIVKTRAVSPGVGESLTYFSDTDPFTVEVPGGASTLFFVICDRTPDDVDYVFTVTDMNDRVYTGNVDAAVKHTHFVDGTYVSGDWVMERKAFDFDPAADFPSLHPEGITPIWYDGDAHDLVTPGVLVDPDSGEPAEDAAVLYYFKRKTNAVPTAPEPDADPGWSYEIPQGTELGDYYVWYQIEGGRYYESVGVTAIAGDFVSIVEPGDDPVLDVEPTLNPDDLVWDGDPKQLLAAGASTSDGTLDYKAIAATSEPDTPGTASDGWVADFNDLTGTDAGSYYIYVRVLGDADHRSKVFGPYGPKAIAKAPATLTCSTDALAFSSSQGAGSTLQKTGVSFTGGTITLTSATPSNCTAAYADGTITVTRVNAAAFSATAITVSVTPDANHYWSSASNVVFNVSGAAQSPLNGGEFNGFLHEGGNEQHEW